MDLNKLTKADRVIVASGLVLFIAYFLPWFEVDSFGFTATASGSDVGFLWATLPMLLGLLAGGLVIATRLFDVKLPDMPAPLSQILLAIGALAAVLVILKLIIGEDPSEIVDRAWGLFVATLAAIGLAVGGYLRIKEDEGSTAAGGTGTGGSAPF